MLKWALVFVIAICFSGAYAYNISYPAVNFRLDNPPVYCIENPGGNQGDQLVSLAQDAAKSWQDNLVASETKNPQLWKISTKVISAGDSRAGCDYTISFLDGGQKQLEANTIILGQTVYGQGKIDIFYYNIGIPIVFNVILHEIGHSLGLGHYVADDNDANKQFSSGDKMAPSIMIPVTQRDPTLIKIMPVDVQKVRSIYGELGFYAYSSMTPPEAGPITPEPTPSPLPTPTPIPVPTPIPTPAPPVAPFESLKITQSQITINPHESKIVRISGQLKYELFHQGLPVYILIIKPDQTTQVFKIPVSRTGYFDVPIMIDSSYPAGSYHVEGSYMDATDASKNFEFTIVSGAEKKSTEQTAKSIKTESKTPVKIKEKVIPKKDKLTPAKKSTPKVIPKTTKTVNAKTVPIMPK